MSRFRGCYIQASIELGPEDLLREVFFQIHKQTIWDSYNQVARILLTNLTPVGEIVTSET